ncbi:CRTAC1 family protein [Roseiconus nitratireducens]|uniref:CRTAC1 family protein n=1 Tax=Roseiconus nitratireducens TaxID=2605748 RepID=A0A5M6D247_9BACT|nr:CRTAC1 family protein [Roseiconus nitratireducens]KAA5539205.1 CRTAC1 family protein [Roseiconus nitratireducens]
MPGSNSPLPLLLAVGVLLSLSVGCQPERTAADVSEGQLTRVASSRHVAETAPSTHQLFDEVGRKSGLNFQHVSGRSLEYRFYEIVGSGAALFDFDGDGDLDIYLVQGHQWDSQSRPPVPQSPVPSDRLFRNDSPQGSSDGDLKFTDVTQSSGLADATGYGQGVACGDYDNDGDVDLYVTNFGPNQLWRNNGDGTFTDVTKQSGAESERWSSSAAFLDFDRDGWFDLYVCNYVNYSFATDKPCFGANGTRDYCGPNSYQGEPDKLFRNDGHGHFIDVSAEAGIASHDGPGLGVVCADFNGDQWPDIYVTNDGMPNRLWMNRCNGSFEDSALLSGCAYNGIGAAEAGMGVDAADCDGDGDEDLFMAHLTNETNTLYLNDGRGGFSDRTNTANLGSNSQAMTGFGAGWIDYDNDGWLDVLVVNGTVKRENLAISGNDRFPRGQPNQLFRNQGGTFAEISDQVDPAFRLAEMSRGLALGDIDNDGDTDFVVVNNEGRARLYRNQVGHTNPWLGLNLVDASGSRCQLGAVVRLQLENGRVIHRRVRRDGSYCSSHDARVLIGVPRDQNIHSVHVTWPDGTAERFAPPSPGRYTTLKQGSGEIDPS